MNFSHNGAGGQYCFNWFGWGSGNKFFSGNFVSGGFNIVDLNIRS